MLKYRKVLQNIAMDICGFYGFFEYLAVKIKSNIQIIIICIIYYSMLKKKIKMSESDRFMKNSLHYQLITFKYAINGIKIFFVNETKAVIHLVASILIITAGFLLHLALAEWLMIIFAIAIVFIAEIFNSAIEQVVDLVIQEKNQTAGIIKDLGAGAVLVSAFTALIIGLLIFIPKFFELL